MIPDGSRIACLALAVVAVSSFLRGAAPEAETFFETEIRPVLATRCVSCHGPDKQAGGTRLDSRETTLAASAGGNLLRTIRGQGTAPAACVLEPRLAAVFGQWIDLGLPWPEKATVASAADRAAAAKRHWAFQPVREPAVPAGAGHPIDAFIRERLAKEGLAFSPEADARTLLRRLSYTLTGCRLRQQSVIG